MNIFELVGMIAIENGDANKAIDETSNKAKAFATAMKRGITDAAKWGAGIATAAAAAALAIGNSIKDIVGDTAQYTKTVSDMSQNMGLSVQSYQEWEYVLGRCNVTMEDLQGGIATMYDRMREVDEGSETAIKNFDKLGLSVFDLNGEMKSADVMFKEIVFALAGIENETERTQLAMEIFSSAGERIAPVLNEGVDGIQAYIDRAHELGLVMGGEDVEAGVEYTQTVYDLGKAFDALKNDLAMTIIPHLTGLAETLLEKIPEIKEKLAEWEEPISNTVEKLVDSLGWVMENPDEVKKALDAIGLGFVALMTLISPVKGAVVAIVGGFINLTSALSRGKTESKKFQESMEQLDKTFSQSMKDIEDQYKETNALLDVIDALAGKTEMTADETARWEEAVERLNELLPGFKESVNEETKEIEGGTQAYRDRAKAIQEVAKAEAATKYLQDKYDAVAEAYGQTGSLQMDIQTNKALLPGREAAYLEAKAAYEEYDKAHKWKPIGSEARKESERLLKEYQQAFALYNSTVYDIEKAQKDLNNLIPQITKAEEELAAAEKAINGGAEGLEEALTTAATALENAAEGMTDAEIIPELASYAENKMQSELNGMGLTVGVTPVISGASYTYRSGSRARNPLAIPEMHSHADGLDYVPYDDYPARLHKGETVLTAKEASAYRSGEGNSRVEAAVNRLYAIMGDVLTAIREGQVIQLETGALVGQTAGAMNERLGALSIRAGRRN